MNIEAIAKFFKDARSIWIGIMAVVSIAVWANDLRYDQRYLTLAAADNRDVKQIRREIADLQVRKGFTDKQKEKQMYETLIKVKENQIKSLKGE